MNPPKASSRQSSGTSAGRLRICAARARWRSWLVEQYFEWARDIADDYAVMDRGAVVLSGASETMNEGEVRRWLTV
jgi:urea transport system ATP-binding protein